MIAIVTPQNIVQYMGLVFLAGNSSLTDKHGLITVLDNLEWDGLEIRHTAKSRCGNVVRTKRKVIMYGICKQEKLRIIDRMDWQDGQQLKMSLQNILSQRSQMLGC